MMSAGTSTELPSVSVVVPAYRQATYIGACLDSIARQTYPGEVDVVVVDDGSPDDSADVARRHALRPKVVQKVNGGVATARNRGVAESAGELVAFLDADDTWLPRKLELQVEALRAVGLRGLSFTRFQRVTPEGEPLPNEPWPDADMVPSRQLFVRRNFAGCSTVLVHRECLERAGGFPESEVLKTGGQDYALWLRIAAYYPLAFVPEVLMHYTVHPTNRVGTDSVKHYEGGMNAVRDFARWDPQRFAAMVAAPVGVPPLALIGAQRSLRLVRHLAKQNGLAGIDWSRIGRAVGRQLRAAP